MKRIFQALIISLLLTGNLFAVTVYSTKDSFGGAGMFYGPGPLKDVELFDVVIRNIGFSTPGYFITPFFNNGGKLPNIIGEVKLESHPDGLFSDGLHKINENLDTDVFELSGVQFLVGVSDSGAHRGQQISIVVDENLMIMTMDFILDMGIGESGIIKLPFYGTTGEVTVPKSLQTQLGIEGGHDYAGSLPSGTKLRGKLGDFDNDGMLDGAIVVAGNMPLYSIMLPGSPYALIRYFETDLPYEGEIMGKLPKKPPTPDQVPEVVHIEPPLKK
jgi:hypothetical protein